MTLRITVVEPVASGGLIHFAYQLCDALAAAGAEVTLITGVDYELAALPHRFKVEPSLRLWSPTDPAPAPSGGAIARLGWRCWRLARRAVRATILVREWVRLVRWLLVSRPDVVQFGLIAFPFQGVFLGLLRRRGLVLGQICHEFSLRESGLPVVARLHRVMSRALYHQFAAVFFLSQATRAEFLAAFALPPARCHVLRHGNQDIFKLLARPGPEWRATYGIAPGTRVALFFGGLRPSKGIEDLLDAFGEMRTETPAILLVVGYPSRSMDVRTLSQRCIDLGIEARVIFDARYLPSHAVAGLIEAADLMVFPYRSATQSGVLQVAYSFGRPVIATRVGGLAEDVEDGASGILVAPRAPAELAAAMARLLDNPDLARRMGARAASLARERHGWSTAAERILAVYHGLRSPVRPPATSGAARVPRPL